MPRRVRCGERPPANSNASGLVGRIWPSPTTGLPSRRHLRRSDGQHAELRSDRAGRHTIHPRVRGRAVVYAVARRAADRPGRAPAGGGGQLWSSLPKAHAVYPDLLEAAGYRVGYTGKGWGPAGSRKAAGTRNPAGPLFKDFERSCGRPEGHAVLLLVRQHRSASARTSRAPGAQSGLKPEASPSRRSCRTRRRCAATPGLLLRGPAVRSRSRRDPRDARTRRRARQHDGHRHQRQRHAVPAGQGQRLRRRHTRAAGHPLARRVARPGAVVDAFVSWPTWRRRSSGAPA